ncbi:MAG: DNA cytosine methyltransferase [bacterium]|nr:DNA cytosine methyltransferase [bacterium]
MISSPKLNYISLFSSAGVGCYGFKLENFNCIATNEIIERRLQVQRYNNKCKYESGYISGDIKDQKTVQKIFEEIERWKKNEGMAEVDVLIATPPCQGISVANHKKKNEKNRNSLIVESIKLVSQIRPKFFIFENVRSFLNTICTDVDGVDKKINEAIEMNLGGEYNILSKIMNFKSFGSNSSRTRTVVIGSRKNLNDITPYDLFPDEKSEKTLKEVIGHLPSLKNMGDAAVSDIYHNFKPYAPHMFEWIKNLKEGESAFDNENPDLRPHRIVDGKKICNENKNGDKYKKCSWNKVAPCVHTRNDILSSQSTIHPVDNRVFSIRELMLMMSIPNSFRWTSVNEDELNLLSKTEKRKFLTKQEINIRQSIGEAVPTEIFRQIAEKIKKKLLKEHSTIAQINYIIKKEDLSVSKNFVDFIKKNKAVYDLPEVLKISELANTKRQDHAAYYTRQDICFSLINELPNLLNKDEINILEPSVGAGNFLPLLFKKYKHAKKINIDVIDIDKNSITILKEILGITKIPKNFHLNFLNDDFLLKKFSKKYDIVIGNPPFGKIVQSKELLNKYKEDKFNQRTNNIFSFFIEKASRLGDAVALISPKSLLSAPEFNLTRELLTEYNFKAIIDYGEKAFNGVKIETIGLIFDNNKKKDQNVKIISYINNSVNILDQNYIFDKKLPVWVIYRDNFFDSIFQKLKFNVFNVFRDRNITKKHTNSQGEIRVLKSRNINNNKIVNIPQYDSYIKAKDLNNFSVSKFLNNNNCILVPNLTYNPRACFLPENSITDGSVAILTPKNGDKINKKHLEYFSSDEFKRFYMTAKNLGTRSLNIDSNFVYFFGIKQ